MDYDAVFRTEASKEFRLPKSASEDNWKSRMTFCNSLSEAITTNGKNRLPANFPEQMEPFFNNILDCAVSERTQLSNSGCKLIALLPKVLGRDMHPHLDRFLPVLLKLCANTKAVTVKVAAAAVSSIIESTTYSPRILWHVCQVFEDKPTGPKVHATTWLQTIMKEYHKSIHSDRDFEMITRSLLLALEDADASVRTNSRATYWTYSKLDPEGAQEIMEKLNKQAKTALLNDPHNPDKKTLEKPKDPPRPLSALAQVREEQKKKRAQEKAQQQRRTFETSTNSQDQIEIHEPRNSKPDRPKRNEMQPPVATTDEDDRKHPSKSSNRSQPAQSAVNTHKKTLSHDSDVAKPTANSRLLSAPVRRPRIVATPMNNTQTSRPSSRTGHTSQAKEQRKEQSREPPQETQPTSFSSSRTAAAPGVRPEKPTRIPISPKAKVASSPDSKVSNADVTSGYQIKSSSPDNRHTTTSQLANSQVPISTSPDSRRAVNKHINSIRSAKFVPEGKENDGIETGSLHKTKDIALTGRQVPGQTSPKKRQPPPAHQPAQDSTFGPYLVKPETSPTKHQTPLTAAHINRNTIEREIDPEVKHQNAKQTLSTVRIGGRSYPDSGRVSDTSPKKTIKGLDVGRAREYFGSLCRNLSNETLPPLGFRRLKGLIEDYNTELIQNQQMYDDFMQLVLYQIVSYEDLEGKKENPADYMINPVYNRQVLLQIIAPLINHFEQWAQNWLWAILYALILYRNTLQHDGTDRRLIYCDQNIDRVIEIARNPLDLIDSAVQALMKGEETLVEILEQKALQEQEIDNAIRDNVDIVATPLFELPEDQQSAIGPSSTMHDGSLEPYSVRCRWKHINDNQAAMHGANLEETITMYMRRSIDEHKSADLSIIRKKLPFLLESGTSALTLILTRATSDGYVLKAEKTDMLCRWAAHCMANYHYVIRRAIVSYCQALYSIMRDDQLFFSYFEDEGQVNLLNYYLVDLRSAET